MRLIVKAPFHEDETLMLDNEYGAAMHDFIGPYVDNVRAVTVNGQLLKEWKEYVPLKNDRIELFVEAGLGALVGVLINLIISFALSMIMQPLF